MEELATTGFAPTWPALPQVGFLNARRVARELADQVSDLRRQIDAMRGEASQDKENLECFGAMSIVERERLKADLQHQFDAQRQRQRQEAADVEAQLAAAKAGLRDIRSQIVETEDLALLQQAGVYQYRHPLSDSVAFKGRLDAIQDQIKDMTRKDGAVLAGTSWQINGSAAQGRAMTRELSKLMLRAFNAEADNLVRGLKPYKLDGAIDRLRKAAEVIQKLGKTMDLSVAPQYLVLRIQELELTADFVNKLGEEKEAERAERERLREERKVQQEIEREREKLDKERRHFENALAVLVSNGDEAGAQRLRDQLADVEKAIADVDYRAANIRAGYVYVISNIGAFGESMVKVGMTRRLDPMDRVRELSDASVPFNFDVHALFFSNDAVGIEQAMHSRLADVRVNLINRRREFFRATPAQAKQHLTELANKGELLEYLDLAEAVEYRQSLSWTPGEHLEPRAAATAGPGIAAPVKFESNFPGS
jgi:hypothetical protein